MFCVIYCKIQGTYSFCEVVSLRRVIVGNDWRNRCSAQALDGIEAKGTGAHSAHVKRKDRGPGVLLLARSAPTVNAQLRAGAEFGGLPLPPDRAHDASLQSAVVPHEHCHTRRRRRRFHSALSESLASIQNITKPATTISAPGPMKARTF